MKTKFIFLSILCYGILLGSSSCSKYLNTVPNGILQEDSIFTSLVNTNAYLAQVYANVPDEFDQRFAPSGYAGPWIAASDEANNYSQLFIMSNQLNQSTWDVNIGGTYWTNFYKPVRTATDFINHIDGANAAEVNSSLKAHFKGEARALRAIFYYWMLRLYGPIPILPSVIPADANGTDILFGRTSFDTCVTYIVTQLDSAYAEIVSDQSHAPDQPLTINIGTSGNHTEWGRVTSGTCKAYIEQTLMLAASPLFNGNTDYASLKNPDGTQLMPQTYDINKWKLAADAAKAFIDEFVTKLGTNQLYTVSDADPFIAAYKSCAGVVTTDWNKEWIWGYSNSGSTGTYEYDITPKLVGYDNTVQKGGGFLAANQSMVDAYFTKNGRSITDPKSGYQSSGFSNFKAPYDVKERNTYNPWTNREPRFYVGITYNNSYWLDQGSSSTEVLANYELHGNSGRTQSTTDMAASGYNVRKNLTPDHSNRGWNYIRLAQIYLDYAEALNEYDPGNPEIEKYVNMIRVRAGVLPYGSDDTTTAIAAPKNQAGWREAIRHERQVEFAFEGVRYFDIRRWKIASQTMGADVYGMNVFADGDAFYQKTFIQKRYFRQRDYLWPIPNGEILKDNLLVQNPGW